MMKASEAVRAKDHELGPETLEEVTFHRWRIYELKKQGERPNISEVTRHRTNEAIEAAEHRIDELTIR